MNRRNFLSKCALSAAVIPTIGNVAATSSSISNVNSESNVEIISLYDLYKKYGVRTQHYTASCLDRNGKFAHESGFDKFNNEPFVRKTYRLQSLPLLNSKNCDSKLLSEIDFLQSSRYSLIDEIKHRMEYVCLAWYVLSGGVWFPIVGGMSKYNYEFKVKNLNVENKDDFEKLCSVYEPLIAKERELLCNPWC